MVKKRWQWHGFELLKSAIAVAIKSSFSAISSPLYIQGSFLVRNYTIFISHLQYLALVLIFNDSALLSASSLT